jgi:hypothetical protein
VLQRYADLASWQFTLGESDIEPYLSALGQHPSEATMLLAASALGIHGEAEIRAYERRKASTTDRNVPAPGRAELAERYAAYRGRSMNRGGTSIQANRAPPVTR